jgi:hypothetical protein
MLEQLGSPHPGPLPVGRGDKYRMTDCFYPYPGAYGVWGRGSDWEHSTERRNFTPPKPSPVEGDSRGETTRGVFIARST